jgi:AcrR family transcriptional regulator
MSPPPDVVALPTRDRIVEAALRLFSERGTSAVSMRELADAASVTVPGLYYHFDSKADLIREVHHARSGRERGGEIERPSPGPLERVVVEQARREFRGLVADREFLRLMQREAVLGDPDALEVQGALALEWRRRWHEVLLLGTDVAPDAELAVAADAIVTFLWGLFVDYLLRSSETVEHRIDDFARVFTPALTAERRRPARRTRRSSR